MRDVLPLLTAGVGICFLGLDLVTTGLQESTSRTLRTLIRRSTKSLPWCAFLGIFAGALMQSTTSVTSVAGSMAATGMLALRQALPIVAFANVGLDCDGPRAAFLVNACARSLQRFEMPRDHGHGRAFERKPFRNRIAQALACTTDDRHLPGELQVHAKRSR